MFKNIRLSSLLLLILILVFLAFGGIFYLSLSNMINLNKESIYLYENNVMATLELKNLENEIHNIRVHMDELLYLGALDQTPLKNLESSIPKLIQIFYKYKTYDLPEEGRELVNKVENSYQLYLEEVDNIITRLKNKANISESRINRLREYEEDLQKNINQLVAYNNEVVQEGIYQAEEVFNSYINLFVGVSVGIFIVITLLILVLIKVIKSSINNMSFVLERISNYEFNINLDVNGKNEFAQMNRSLDKVINNMKRLISEVKLGAEGVTEQSQSLSAISQEMSASSQELAATMQQVSMGAINQTEDLSGIAKSMDDITIAIESAYNKIKNVSKDTEIVIEKVRIGKEEVNILEESIENIRKAFESVVLKIETLTNSIKEIGGFTQFITEIADQTNLLALNAAIEAARAGEHGRGFAVVAEEVRNLAEETKKSSEKIKSLVISTNRDNKEVLDTSMEVKGIIKGQGEVLKKSLYTFDEILKSIEKITPLVKESYTSMDEIVSKKDDVIHKVKSASIVAKENSTSTQEVAASSEELSTSSEEVSVTAQNLNQIAVNLLNTVNQFKV